VKTTILSEARDGRVTVTLTLPFKEASMLLDVVTDSVLLGNTKGDVQEWAEQLMRDLDDHLQRNEGSQKDTGAGNTPGFFAFANEPHRCPYCGYYGPKKVDGKGNPAPCTNCGDSE
jgi:hypothetical protein